MKNKNHQIKTIVSLIIIFVILCGLLYPQVRRGRRVNTERINFRLMILLIIWLSFGIISSTIATYKGRNNWCWFFLGLIPIWGLILILFLPKTQESKENDALRNGSLRKCPYCAEAIKTDAIKCKHCGEESTATRRK